MSWTTILTILVLTVMTTILEMVYGWTLRQAFMATGGVAVCLMIIVTLILGKLTPADERTELWPMIRRAMGEEWKAMIKTLRGK